VSEAQPSRHDVRPLMQSVTVERKRLYEFLNDAPQDTLVEFISGCNLLRTQHSGRPVQIDAQSAKVMAVCAMIVLSEWTEEVLK